MPAYVVLRDLRGASTAGPFEGGAASIDEKAPSEPRVEVEELAKDDVRALARDPGVRALAPVMPTRLVRPVELDADAAATTAWGIGAVGADSSTPGPAPMWSWRSSTPASTPPTRPSPG